MNSPSPSRLFAMANICFIIVLAVALSVTSNVKAQQQCYVSGQCTDGEPVGVSSEVAVGNCLATCKDTTGCTWFTYDKEGSVCWMLESCSLEGETCPDCISGESSCPICGLKGLCQGPLIASDPADSVEACEGICAGTPGCNFYTFRPYSQECDLFPTCNSQTVDDCPYCTSGQPECFSTTKYMFIVGGTFTSNESSINQKTELVPLSGEETQIPDCLANLANHPNEIYSSAGGALPDSGNLPHVCGSSYSPHDECWQYEPTSDSWIMTSKIVRNVEGAASAYHENWGIIMSGGLGTQTYYVDNVTLTTNGEDFTELPTPVPEEYSGYCVAGIDKNRIFVTGLGINGLDVTGHTYMYYKDLDQWDDTLPQLPLGRFVSNNCGVANQNGHISVVVVGGYIYSTYFSEVNIFSVEERTWRTGNPFPVPINLPAVAQYGNSFYIIGGLSRMGIQSYYYDTIYRYEPDDDSWTLLPNRLKYPRYGATAMIVDRSIFPACK